MAAKKSAPVVPGMSITGARLDPVDGQPVFAEIDSIGVSRVRWLKLTAKTRKAALVEELKQPVKDDQEG